MHLKSRGFWLGAFESLIVALFGGGFFSIVWNVVLGFAVAYTLYWTMTYAPEPKLMKYALLFICLYVVFNVYMGLQNLLFVLPAVLYFGKALCDALMLISGYHLLKDQIGEEPLFML